MNDLIKVCIIEDDESYRETIKEILEKDERIRIYGEYHSGYDFIHSLKSPFDPDICLVDILLSDEISGIECGKRIKAKNQSIHIIFMTAYPNAKTLSEARNLGDFIEKGTMGQFLIDKIIDHLEPNRKEYFISLKKSQEKVGENILVLAKEIDAVNKRIICLSASQKKVLKLRKAGKTIDEIANLLGMKINTVKTHLERGLKKLALPNILKYIDL